MVESSTKQPAVYGDSVVGTLTIPLTVPSYGRKSALRIVSLFVDKKYFYGVWYLTYGVKNTNNLCVISRFLGEQGAQEVKIAIF